MSAACQNLSVFTSGVAVGVGVVAVILGIVALALLRFNQHTPEEGEDR